MTSHIEIIEVLKVTLPGMAIKEHHAELTIETSVDDVEFKEH